MMLNLIRRLVFDVSLLNEHIKMPLKVIIQKKKSSIYNREFPTLTLHCVLTCDLFITDVDLD